MLRRHPRSTVSADGWSHFGNIRHYTSLVDLVPHSDSFALQRITSPPYFHNCRNSLYAILAIVLCQPEARGNNNLCRWQIYHDRVYGGTSSYDIVSTTKTYKQGPKRAKWHGTMEECIESKRVCMLSNRSNSTNGDDKCDPRAGRVRPVVECSRE